MTEIPEHLRKRANEARKRAEQGTSGNAARIPEHLLNRSRAAKGEGPGSSQAPLQANPQAPSDTRGNQVNTGRSVIEDDTPEERRPWRRYVAAGYLALVLFHALSKLIAWAVFTGKESNPLDWLVIRQLFNPVTLLYMIIVWSFIAALVWFATREDFDEHFNDMSRLKRAGIGLGMLWMIPLFVHAVIKLHHLIVFPGYGSAANWYDRLIEGGYKGLWVWAFAAIMTALSAIVLYVADYVEVENGRRGAQHEHVNQTLTIASLFTGVIAVVLVVVFFTGIRWNPKHEADFYVERTFFAISDLDERPDSLELAFRNGGIQQDQNGTEGWVSDHDPQISVIEGSLPAQGWQERGTSLQGATLIMSENSGSVSGTDVLTQTRAYIHLPLEDGQDPSQGDGVWSMIRDGDGINKPLAGVVEWDGRSQDVHECRFEGDYSINRSLRGSRLNDMPNLIFEKEGFETFSYELADSYGYCDGPNRTEPVVVIPMREQRDMGYSVVDEFAGVLTIRGSASGDPQLDFFQCVSPGQIPGPVYPETLAAKQRVMSKWGAGREYNSRNNFGFEPASFFSQDGNVGEYHLRNLETGRTEYVTPLTLRGSRSQLVVAYAVMPADEACGGQLNDLTIYVLDDHAGPDTEAQNPEIVIINLLELAVRDFILDVEPNFVNSGGSYQEFIPSADGSWTAFGILNRRPVFILRIDPQSNRIEIEPTLGAGYAGVVSGDSITQLSEAELFEQLGLVVDEIERRGVKPNE